jgi:hypothetical protein
LEDKVTLELDVKRAEQRALEANRLANEKIDRDWAERRTLERQRYERERYDREHPVAQQSDPIGHYIAIGVFATFPEARRWLLIACGGGVLLSIVLIGFMAVLPKDVGALFMVFCFGLGGLSIAAFLGLWIPSTIAAYVVPKMKDRWLGIDGEEEEDEDEDD